ncbi:MAG: sulfite exporter TauE/SafE family protein [Proteobacteria bacterium]|nr:sulfite exporter TauE/SafE family protein [Pseudomonadota bacterium]MBS0572360.1 sulfite exporter TauE/SafE family protein [Pseudomonadota bacterium]
MSLPYDLGPWGAAYLGLAFLVAAFVRGYSGFGFSALVVSAAGLVTNPLNLVATVTFCEFLMTLQQWHLIRHDVDWRRVGLLMAGALAGVPLGLWALTSVGVDAARAAISLYVLAMCAALLGRWRLRTPPGGGAHLLAGVASGLANAPGMGGLPVVTFFAAQAMPAPVFRATLVAYFPFLDLFSAPLYWWHGMLTWDTLIVAALALPVIGLGVWLGGRHFLRTDPQEFRRFAILLLAFLAALGLVRSAVA